MSHRIQSGTYFAQGLKPSRHLLEEHSNERSTQITFVILAATNHNYLEQQRGRRLSAHSSADTEADGPAR